MEIEAATSVARFTGLDTDTVKTQILPYLSGLQDSTSVRHHLQGLLGPGVAQSDFINKYVEHRFPSRSVAAEAPGHAPQGSRNLPSSSRAEAVDLSSAFGTSGSVYVKSKGEPTPSSSRPRSDPHRQPGASHSTFSNLSQSSAVPKASRPPAATDSAPAANLAIQTAQPAFQLAATEKMKALDAEISELTSGGESTSYDNSGRKRRARNRTCFCQGRSHSLFQRRPICMRCGLLQCSLNVPSPFALDSLCGSCSSPLLSAGERSSLLSSLVAEREEAERQALIRAEEVRQQRERAKADKVAAAAATPSGTELFPELSGGDASARQRQQDIAIAMGRRQAPTDLGGNLLSTSGRERQSRVLTIGKKGKVTVGSTGKAKKPAAKNSVAVSSSSPAANSPPLPTAAAERSDTDEEAQDLLEAETRRKLGIVFDANDDGVRQSETILSPAKPAYTGSKAGVIQYIPRDERPHAQREGESGETEGPDEMGEVAAGTVRSTVPGAAESSKGRRKGERSGKTK